MVDYYVEDHWNKLIPANLTSDLEELLAREDNDDVWNVLIDGRKSDNLDDVAYSYPSLRTFFEDIRQHSLPQYLNQISYLGDLNDVAHRSAMATESTYDRNLRDLEDDPAAKKPKIDSTRKKNNTFMSDKKEHEISRMARCVGLLAASVGADVVVDVGSGKGYLGQELSTMTIPPNESESRIPEIPVTLARNRFKVVGIEGNDSTSHGAVDRRDKMMKKGRRLLVGTAGDDSDFISSVPEVGKFTAVSANVSGASHLSSILGNAVEKIRCDETVDAGERKEGSTFLCGLHACGGLTSTILRSFVGDVDGSAGVCVVGCCYHHLRESGDGLAEFPLSRPLSRRDFVLGRNALMLANQPPARSIAFNRRPSESLHLRAVFEVVLRRHIGLCHRLNKGVGKVPFEDPLQYLKKALIKCGYGEEASRLDDSTLSDTLSSFHDHRRRLFSFFRLRTSLAPVVETVVVLDRLLFLMESPSVRRAGVLRLFDPVTSPRCYALIGLKS